MSLDDLAHLDVPPSDVTAERVVLGSCITSAAVFADCRMVLTDDGEDFYSPTAKLLWLMMVKLADADKPVEITSLLATVNADEVVRRTVTGKTLFDLTEAASPSATYYAQRVSVLAGLRRLITVCTRGAYMASAAVQNADDDTTIPDLIDRVRAEVASAAPRTALAARASVTVREFTEQPDEPHQWLVEGLIERQDVFMLLAGEGVGKTVLSRQMVMAVGQGVHPFDQYKSIPPRRTLLVDLENPTGMARRNMRDGRSRLERASRQALTDDAYVWMRPEGLNLRKPADAALLEREIAETGAELVAFGSLYKSFLRSGDDWETAADDVRAVFDRLRARYGCAFWLEHHMPKGDGTTRPQLPFGSSVWQRWAGFGRVLDRVGPEMYKLSVTFRGDREPREIPVGLTRGMPNQLHWVPVWEQHIVEAGRAA